MRLDTVIVADAAAQAGGKLSILGAWTTRLRPQTFPWSEPFSVIVRAYLDEEDYERPQAVEIVVEGPAARGMSSRFEPDVAQLQEGRAKTVEGEQHAIVFTTTQYGFQFLEPGLYEVVVRFDSNEVARYPLPVVPADADIPPPSEGAARR